MGCCFSMKLNYDLKSKNNSIKYFSFNGKKTKAKIVDIYDGDTCTIVFLHRGEYIKYKSRAYGYDTHELHPRKNLPNREDEIIKAKTQKQEFTKLLVYNKGIVDVELKEFDKYGRILTIYYGENKEKSINDIMVEKYEANPYYGGTKI